MRFDDLAYDFETDEWVELNQLRTGWVMTTLPPPPTAPTEGRWTAAPTVDKRLKRSYRFLAAAGVAFLVLNILQYAVIRNYSAEWVFSAILLFGVPSAAFLLSRPSSWATEEDFRVLENSSDFDTCLVEITIVRRGLVIGKDRGVVWFEKGRLLFTGQRTSFAIGGEDMLPRKLWGYSLSVTQHHILPLRTRENVQVRFGLIRDNRLPYEQERRFLVRFRAFCFNPPESKGPRQWPPLERSAKKRGG